MNLDEMRVFVRTQLDVDSSDLPDALLNVYIQEGYERVIAVEQRWPFFETMWTFTIPAGGVGMLPIDTRVIEELTDSTGRMLSRADVRWVLGEFGVGATGTPSYWTTINRTIQLYPAPTVEVDLIAHGFRMASDWISIGAASEVDADTRLHIPIAWYACSLGYAQQEDEVLEQTYLNRFNQSVGIAQQAVMKPWTGQPRQAFHKSYRRWGGARFLPGIPG